MARPIGFSTGSLSQADFGAALETLRGTTATAIELSALREDELEPLMCALPSLDLRQYKHVAVHAPSALHRFDECRVVELLRPAIAAGLPIIVHADLIKDFKTWRTLGNLLCVENMDKRKPTGRTCTELAMLFDELPKARLCLDVAHARQIDPTMCEAVFFLTTFVDRLAQLHLSELNAASRHGPLSFAGVLAFSSVYRFVPFDLPIILEHESKPHELEPYLSFARSLGTASSPRLHRSAG